MKNKLHDMFHGNSLRSRLLTRVLIIHALLLVAALFIWVSQMRNLTTYFMEQRVNNRLIGVDRLVSQVVEKYEVLLQGICSNPYFADAVEDHTDAPGEELSDVFLGTMHTFLKGACDGNEDLCGIKLFIEGKPVYCYSALKGEESDAWLQSIPDIGENEPDGTVSEILAVREGSRAPHYFTVKERLYSIEQPGKSVGTLVLCVRAEALNFILTVTQDDLFVIERNGSVVVCPDEKLVDCEISVQDARIGTRLWGGSHVEERRNERTGWNIVEFYSLHRFQRAMNFIYGMLVTSVFCILLLMCVTLQLAYRPIVHFVRALTEVMNRVRGGELKARMGEENGSKINELNEISQNFDEMLGAAEVLVEQNSRNWEERKQAEIQALEAQINPHFIYNSLDTINWKAIEKEQFEISEMITDLADIMRYTIRYAGEETTLRDELQWLNRYVRMQQNKLGRPILLEADIPSPLFDARLYKLLLQPLVENSIRSMQTVERDLILRLRVRSDGQHLVIAIRDSGRGLSPEMLEELNDISYHKEGHFGIENLRKRLQLYYGEYGHLEFHAVEDGTEAVVTIPAADKMDD